MSFFNLGRGVVSVAMVTPCSSDRAVIAVLVVVVWLRQATMLLSLMCEEKMDSWTRKEGKWSSISTFANCQVNALG